jgi:hypothetical protein
MDGDLAGAACDAMEQCTGARPSYRRAHARGSSVMRPSRLCWTSNRSPSPSISKAARWRRWVGSRTPLAALCAGPRLRKLEQGDGARRAIHTRLERHGVRVPRLIAAGVPADHARRTQGSRDGEMRGLHRLPLFNEDEPEGILASICTACERQPGSPRDLWTCSRLKHLASSKPSALAVMLPVTTIMFPPRLADSRLKS